MSDIPEKLRQRIRAQANNQCGYGKSQQQYVLGWYAKLGFLRNGIHRMKPIEMISNYQFLNL
jgi:hypothetical protein